MTENRAEDRPDRRRRLGAALAVGAALVVLVELASLVRALAGESDPLESGALWTILLMILVTFGTVAAIGWGLYLAIRDSAGDNRGEVDPDIEQPSEDA